MSNTNITSKDVGVRTNNQKIIRYKNVDGSIKNFNYSGNRSAYEVMEFENGKKGLESIEFLQSLHASACLSPTPTRMGRRSRTSSWPRSSPERERADERTSDHRALHASNRCVYCPIEAAWRYRTGRCPFASLQSAFSAVFQRRA